MWQHRSCCQPAVPLKSRGACLLALTGAVLMRQSNNLVPSTHQRFRVMVRSLDATTDLTALAADIVDKCKLIHPSKVKCLGG